MVLPLPPPIWLPMMMPARPPATAPAPLPWPSTLTGVIDMITPQALHTLMGLRAGAGLGGGTAWAVVADASRCCVLVLVFFGAAGARDSAVAPLAAGAGLAAGSGAAAGAVAALAGSGAAAVHAAGGGGRTPA